MHAEEYVDTGIKGKVVLITGASRNMGRGAAIAFAGEGANLVPRTSTQTKELNEVAGGGGAAVW